MPQPVYVIGDIHGQAAELDRVLTLIEGDGGPKARIVFLGDYVDRGPDSSGVMERLVEGRRQGRDWTFLMGNHDRMFGWFMQAFPQHDPTLQVDLNWLNPRLGGDTTLASYGVKVGQRERVTDIHARAREAVPQAHLDFLQSLALCHETPELFFAHAGIRPGVPLAEQTEQDLLWIRRDFHEATAPHPKLIVHGHTPVDSAAHYGNRVNLDTGAGYGKPLCAAVFEGTEAWVLTEQGRNRLRP